MDLGSKYLHQSSILSEKGFEMYAYDIPEIVGKKEVQKLADEKDIKLRATGNLAKGELAQKEGKNTYDAILVTEVLEHLAFNPLIMWKSIFRVLKPKSHIFISTPNSLSLNRRVVTLARVLAGVGVGVSVSGVMGTPTYGHHWKEYSIKEVYRYFEILNIPKKDINISTYEYRPYKKEKKIRYKLENVMRKLGNKTYNMADEIFAVIRVPSPKPPVPSSEKYI
jgi:2-polyprenyl-6-hydroxyphenyl methylase/3-demethylubiquinone-9 3-methyltransferase